jgi:hypothetical protein
LLDLFQLHERVVEIGAAMTRIDCGPNAIALLIAVYGDRVDVSSLAKSSST